MSLNETCYSEVETVMAKVKRRGPQNTLVDEPHMAQIRARLAEAGFDSLKAAAAKTSVHYDTFVKTCRFGFPADPKQRIVEAMKDLGIFDLIPPRRRAS